MHAIPPGTITHRLDRDMDAVDVVNARHSMAQGILVSLSMSFDCKDSVPASKTVQNALWAVQELLDQAHAAVKSMELCD